MSLQPILIAGEMSGLTENVKPWLVPDQAFTKLYNAYVYRDRVIKRECLTLLGRLERLFASVTGFPITLAIGANTIGLLNVSSFVSTISVAAAAIVTTTYPHGLTSLDNVIITGIVGTMSGVLNGVPLVATVLSPTTFSVPVNTGGLTYTSGGFIFSNRALTATESNAELAEGTVAQPLVLVIGAQTLTDSTGSGIFVITGGATPITAASINYTTGIITLISSANVGPLAVTMTYGYYPSLPVMEITQREKNYPNVEDAVVFDIKYAYTWNGTSFQEYIPGTIWSGGNFNGFWTSNFTAGSATTTARFFFVTNFINNDANPIRYTSDGLTWIDFAPFLSVSAVGPPKLGTNLWQALIILPYYGRLIMLNTWEGSTASGRAGALNYYNRARFSAIGDPTNVTAWQTDIPGRGGFIDAPTNEAIQSAAYYKNTLIVFFENSTWQLRYNGEYGLPFLWERISSDFGCVSTFSAITFDESVIAVGDKAIIRSTDLKTERIDLAIPDQIFDFENENNGPMRVQGVRDFRRELAFWSYVDSEAENEEGIFPNRVLVYNYRNNSFAIFRDNVTCFGTFQSVITSDSINWDSQEVTWDSYKTTWDDPDNQANFPYVMAGNQQGFVHYYGQRGVPDAPSLTVSAVTLVGPTVQLTIFNHNLEAKDVIYLSGFSFVDAFGVPAANGLNGNIYRVKQVSPNFDPNNIVLEQYSFTNNSYYTNIDAATGLSGLTYVGSGTIALFPVMDIITKDFNPYMTEGKQMKISSIDFMTDVSDVSAITVNLYANAQTGSIGNMPLGNNEVETYLVHPYCQDVPSRYAWHRFYATLFGQFLRIELTYDDILVNTYSTHTNIFELNAMKLNIRPGGYLVF
jgi:hypothetical protein